MIYEVARELETALRDKGVPLPVVYGPEPTRGDSQRERIVVQRTEDDFGPLRSQWTNPRGKGLAILQGVTIRIYARSPMGGSRIHDHERRAYHVLDRIIVALDKVVRSRKNNVAITAGGIVPPVDVTTDGATQTPWPGVVYELRLTVDRGVFDRTWPTAADPNGGIADEAVVGIDVTLITPTPELEN